ncbi:hypothetical protein [Mesorhizobium sp. M0037]|uniref:hypothetical protein n=1 Tax=unclassified Mesorhizobium TaxID=325217 RepID=UPI00333C5981
MFTSHDLRKALIESGWPAAAIAKGAKIPENVAINFLEGTRDIAAGDMARLDTWAAIHTGTTSTGKQTFTRYPGPAIPMGTIIAPDARTLPCGPWYADNAPLPTLTVTDEDVTLANLAKLRHGDVTGVGKNIQADKVIAGEQIVKKAKAA